MIRIRLKYWIAKCKTLTKIALFILVIAIFYLGYEILGGLFSGADSNIIGVYGALFGAFLGGVLSLGGSIWVHNRQLKSMAEIKRKEEIFIPLYDELIQLNNILFISDRNISDKFPQMIDIDGDFNQSTLSIPIYKEWIKIKNSSYLLELPEILKINMEKLSQIIRAYNKDFIEAVTSIEPKCKSVLNDGMYLCNDAEIISVMRYILQDRDIDYLADCFGISSHTKGPKWKAETKEKMDRSIKNDTNYSSIKENYHLLEIVQYEIIDILKYIINTTIYKYEK